MHEYRIDPIDKSLILNLDKALSQYRAKIKASVSYEDLKIEHKQIVKAFNALLDARNAAIDKAIPNDNFMMFQGYKITILLDEEVENALNNACSILSAEMKGVQNNE